VLVVKYTSPVTLSLCGILKDISLVCSSTFIFGTSISALQVVGYGISIIGLLIYRAYKQDPTIIMQKFDMLYDKLCRNVSDSSKHDHEMGKGYNDSPVELEGLLPSEQRH